MMLNSSVGTFRAARLRATLAAPPGMKLSLSSCTTGTGASGEIRRTDPQMNSSSITSPTTRILVREAPEISSFSRFALRVLGAMDDIPFIRNDPVRVEMPASRAVGSGDPHCFRVM